MQRILLAAAVLFASGGCQGETAPDVSSDAGPTFSSLAGREYILKVPRTDSGGPLPLIIAMHGYGSDAPDVEAAFGLDALADQQGFYVVYPRGTLDPTGNRFFNATDACCNFYGSNVDDVGFIGSLIDHLTAEYAIDPTRIYAVGHSNGAFMSFRLACDLSPRIAGIVALEGAMWNEPWHCGTPSPVALLEVHGSADTTVSPFGGVLRPDFPSSVYPSVAETMADWQRFDECSATVTIGASPEQIDSLATGPVVAERWEGCAASVEHWTIPGGTHAPTLTPAWPTEMTGFLMAQRKPPT